jgi:hypothetical protein
MFQAFQVLATQLLNDLYDRVQARLTHTT